MAAVSVKGVLIADGACLKQVVRHIALACTFTGLSDGMSSPGACSYP